MKRRFAPLLVLAASLLLGLMPPAQGADDKMHMAAVQAAAAATMPAPAAAPAAPLNITVDRGVPITLSSPASSVFIANPDVADIQVMSPTSVMVFGKKTGETSLVATNSSGQTILHRTIVVVQDLTDLRRALATAIPDNKIEAQALPDGIVLTGEVHDAAAVNDAQKIASRYISKDGSIVNRVHMVGSNQIQLRVRFAEVSRTVDDTLGIDWAGAASYGGMVFGLFTGAAFLSNPASSTFTRTSNAALTIPQDAGFVGTHGKRLNLNSMIDALAQDGLVTILAEPTLMAMSGETASFLAGGEFPIPIPQSGAGGSGGGTGVFITVEFKHYGVSLSFTPTLIGEDRINLHVKPEVSQLTDIGAIKLSDITVPALTTRKAETTIELASGQSFAIAGLLNNNQAQTVDKFPILGDMPIIGPLFRSSRFQNGQSELVIIVTPYIVKPANNTQALAMPTDGFSSPSETDRVLRMRYNSSDPSTRTMSGQPIAVRTAAPAAANNLTSGRAAEDAAPPAPAEGPMSLPAPAAAPVPAVAPASQPAPAPAESGGFIVE